MNKHQKRALVGLGRQMKARGQGSLAAGAVAAGAAPGATGTDPSAAANGPDRKKSNFHPLKVLAGLETGSPLDGKQLNQAARALTALEIRPQLHGYKQLAKQLKRERNVEATGLGKLGNELQGNVAGVYGNIADSEAQSLARQQAIGNQLTQQSGQIAQQGSANLAAMQKDVLGEQAQAQALRGAPTGGTAQAQLDQAVAQQQAAQSANSQAAQQFAAQQAAGSSSLQAALGSAAQMQGGSAVGSIGRSVVGRVGESNQKYNEGIQTALGKLADVKATKGATLSKNLLDLREKEQKFKLGEQAVAGKKNEQKLSEKENAEDRKQKGFENKLALKEYGLNQWEAEHPNAGTSKTNEKKQELRHDAKEVKSLIPSLVAEFGAPPKNQQQLNVFIGKANSKAGADPSLVRHVIENWWSKKYKEAAKDPNGASYGR